MLLCQLSPCCALYLCTCCALYLCTLLVHPACSLCSCTVLVLSVSGTMRSMHLRLTNACSRCMRAIQSRCKCNLAGVPDKDMSSRPQAVRGAAQECRSKQPARSNALLNHVTAVHLLLRCTCTGPLCRVSSPHLCTNYHVGIPVAPWTWRCAPA